MAADIVPIEFELTAGPQLTLWAPRWIEDGEEWEAFLGSGDHLYGFPELAELAAFIHSDADHDLLGHPAWPHVLGLLPDELMPAEDAQFDIVGVYDLVAQAPDMWSVGELARIVAILRSVAEVCDLDAVEETLDAAVGFDLCAQGPNAFMGRAGMAAWDEVGRVVASSWGTVIDALDNLIHTPATNANDVDRVRTELSKLAAQTEDPADRAVRIERDERSEFWEAVGVDPISLSVGGQVGYSLRCYLDDVPLFLSRDGAILVFTKSAALEKFLADTRSEHSMAELDFFAPIATALAERSTRVYVAAENRYSFDDVLTQLTAGPPLVDIEQLELATELLEDVAAAFDDEVIAAALAPAAELGSLISALVSPDPLRLPPEPPYDAEAHTMGELIEAVANRLSWNPTRSA